jgi:FkbM family methyltransferase
MKSLIRRTFQAMGFDIVKYRPASHALARRKWLIEVNNIDVVLDVGANTGQYGKELRSLGYAGRIISFEPLSQAYTILSSVAARDPLWESMNIALGDAEYQTMINISGSSPSSSILDILPASIEIAPQIRYVGQEQIDVKSLDSFFDDLVGEHQHVYLKIDTQGFERNVLEGAKKSLQHIDMIQLEMSLVPIYRDETLFDEMYKYLVDRGYALVSVEQGFSNGNTGQLLQVDGVFSRM